MTVASSVRPNRHFAEAAAVAAAHLCLVWFSLTVVFWSNGVAAIWPCNAVLVTYLLLRPVRNWLLPCVFVFFTCCSLTFTSERPEFLSVLFAIANVAESVLVAAAMKRWGSARPNLAAPEDLAVFVAAATGAVSVSAAIAGLGLTATGEPFGPSWLSWFAPDALGLLIVVPLLLISHQALTSGRLPARRQALGSLVTFGIVAAISAIVFLQHSRTLLFLIGPAVLLATFRMRGIGAAIATLIVVVIGAAGLANGTGPLALMQTTAEAKVTLLQLFFATTFLTALPVAAILAQRDRFARQLQDSEAQFRTVVDAVNNVIFRTDVPGRWTFLNPAWERMTGFSCEQSLGESFLHHVLAEDRAGLLQRLEGLKTGVFDAVEYQCRFRTADGDERWAEARIHRLEGPDGELIGSAGILADVSDRVALAAHTDEARRRAEHNAAAALLLAATDELTGVASRRAFMAMFEQELGTLARAGAPLSVALFDIDFFKRVNDSHGHAAGDEVLRRVAAIAKGCVRDHDLVGRLGGEEFAILMPGASLQQAALVAERFRAACAADADILVTISIGVASASADSTPASLLREADEALYRAKNEGRNCMRLAA